MRLAFAPALLAALLLAPPLSAEEVLLDGIAAQVGTDIVLISEVMELARPQERSLRERNAPPQQIAQVRADALETVIEWRLIEQMVKQTELYASEAEMDTTIEAIAKENGLTLEQLKRSLTTQGMSWDTYRAEIKRELERRKLVNAIVASQVQLDEAEVAALYAERFSNQPETGTSVHLRQLLAVGGEAGSGATIQEACDLVRKARSTIRSEREFAEFATRYSAVAAEKGGDLGWMHDRQLAGYMREMIEGLQPGQLSEVKELPIGCTLVQLVERKEFRPVSFEEARTKLQDEIYEHKLMAEYRDWMEELRARTFIERRGYFADAASFTTEDPSGSQFEAGISDVNVLRGDTP